MEPRKIKFIASVDTKDPKEIQDIAEQLRQKGCRIDRILEFTGTITGETLQDISSLETLKVRGIKFIEEDREIRALE
jgi:hypothetical protein